MMKKLFVFRIPRYGSNEHDFLYQDGCIGIVAKDFEDSVIIGSSILLTEDYKDWEYHEHILRFVRNRDEVDDYYDIWILEGEYKLKEDLESGEVFYHYHDG